MKSRATLILALCALLVGGLVVLDYYQGTPTDKREADRGRLLDLDGATVDHVELIRSNQTIVLEKHDSRWELKQPITGRADPAAVNSLVDELEFVKRDRTLTAQDLAGIKLADLGLAAPRLKVTLQGRQKSVTVLVGTNTPTAEAVYFQIQGRPDVAIVNKGVADRLDKSLTDLRDRVVLEVSPAAATRLEIRAVDRVLELARVAGATNAEPRWAMIQPLAARADADRVRGLWQDLAGLRVQEFVSDDPQAVHTYQLQEPVREIFLRQGEADPGTTLLIGRPLTNDATRVYAKLRGANAIFTLAADAVRKLDLSANDLRDRHVLPFATDQVRTLEVTRGADTLLVQQGAAPTNEWRLIVPVELAADRDRVGDLLQDLHDLRATQFVADVATDLERFGLTVPSLIVTLKGEGTNVVGQLLVGALDASNQVRYARHTAEPFIYGIAPPDLARLPAAVNDLRTRQVAAVAPGGVRKLTIRHDQQETVLERGPDTKWRLVVPAQGALNNDLLDDVLRELSDLRAEAFLTASPENIAAVAKGSPAVTIVAETATKSFTLAIGPPRAGGEWIASWSDPVQVFTLPAPVAATLTTTLVATPAPAPAPAATNAPPAAAK